MERINFRSNYLEFANASLDWLPMDTEELYQHNLTNNYSLLEQNGWINTKITYEFNSHGFRCDEFKEDSIMFLGCSFTCGIGLAQHMMWPEILSARLNKHCSNLGLGGSSPDTAFRMCLGYIDTIKPRMVIYLEPPIGRIELVSDKKAITLAANYDLDHDKNIKQYYKLWIQDGNHNCLLNAKKNKLAIEQLCCQRSIPFAHYTIDDIQTIDLARDLAHIGPRTSQQFVDDIHGPISDMLNW